LIDTLLSGRKYKGISQRKGENSLKPIVLIREEIFSFCTFFILSEIILALSDAI